jgi:hypothetical protein
MKNTSGTKLIWGLSCALALIVGLIAGRMGLVGLTPNAMSLANFRPDFPLTQIQSRTFKNETVQIDGNEFIDCTFDNVTFKFNGQAPFHFSNVHFHVPSKFEISSDNPIVKSTMELVSAFQKLEAAGHNQSQQNRNQSNENK